MNDDRSEPTVACSLQPAELQDRSAMWEQLAERALRDTRSTTDGVQLVFAGSDETERELRELARLETQCCSFAAWRVTRSGEEILVDITAGGDGIPAVRALFGLA